MTGPGLVSPAGYGLQSDNGSSGWDRRESMMVRKADTANTRGPYNDVKAESDRQLAKL